MLAVFANVGGGLFVECRCNTNTVRVPTATPGGDRGEKAKPRWVGFWRVAVGGGAEGGDAEDICFTVTTKADVATACYDMSLFTSVCSPQTGYNVRRQSFVCFAEGAVLELRAHRAQDATSRRLT